MRCEEFERRVFDGGDVTQEMLEHAKTCEACRVLLEHADLLAGSAGLDDELDVPPSFAQGWRTAVRSEAAKGRAPGLIQTLGKRAAAWLSGFAGVKPARGLAFAMCAVALVGVGALMDSGGRLGNDYSVQKSTAMVYGAAPENSMMMRAAGTQVSMSYDMAEEEMAVVQGAQQERKIVRTAQLSLEVADMDEAMLNLRERTLMLGGAVTLQEIEGVKGEGRYGYMELSVPSEQLDGVLGEAEARGKVLHTSLEETDMSASYYDNASRLESARAQKQRLDELYAQAEEMSDIVTITDAIFDVQQEIDALAGQNAWIDNRADNARVRIELTEKRAQAPQEETSFLAQLASSFMDGLGAIGTFFGGLALFAVWVLPWLALIAMIAAAAWAVLRFARRK